MFYAKKESNNILKGSKRHSSFMTKQTFTTWGEYGIISSKTSQMLRFLITYVSGKGASVVIWVVKYAREEHKAAVEWLNNHTDDKIGFFLCEIKLFQIGNSDIVPSFTVVERPNDWTKEIKKTTATKPTQQQRLEYWNVLNEYAYQNTEFARAFRKYI